MGRELFGIVTLVAAASCAIALIAIRHRLKRLARMTKAEEMVEAFRAQCHLSEKKLRKIGESLWNEMGVALRTEDSTLKMLPSFVDRLPTGKEKGLYYALDLGGTNFRVIRVLLGGGEGGVLRRESEEVAIPPALMTATTEALFDFIADAVANVIEGEGDEFKEYEGRDRELGFTFSFPVDQIAINRGKLIRWTKGFKVAGTEGQEVVAILERSLKARGVPLRVAALVNDTVGTLVGGRYSNQSVEVGVIIGTGTNACYVEKGSLMGKKLPASFPSQGNMVINIEWGNFASDDLPYTFADRDLDAASLNKGEQHFEKLISGMYLGEIVRRFLVRLAAETGLFGKEVPALLEEAYSLSTPTLSKMEMDRTAGLDFVGSALANLYGITHSSLNTRKLVKDVCSIVTERGARLAGAGVFGVLERIRRGNSTDKALPLTNKITVAVDGGLYEHFDSFRTQMREAMDSLLEEDAEYVEMILSTDGSGLGAALIAATYSSA